MHTSLLVLIGCATSVPEPVDDPPLPREHTFAGDDPGATTPTVPEAPRLSINELCASNRSVATDEDGGHPDWIELYAPGPDDFPLAGLTISDDEDDPGLHAFDPNLVVPGGGRLVLWADG